MVRKDSVEVFEEMDPVLSPLGRAFQRTFAAFERETGMSAPKWFVLTMLSRKDGVSQGEVRRRFRVDPSRITRLARSLEDEGLLRRERDPEDSRVVRLYLTGEGRRTVREFPGQRESFDRRVREAMSEEEMAGLQRGLEALAAAMDS